MTDDDLDVGDEENAAGEVNYAAPPAIGSVIVGLGLLVVGVVIANANKTLTFDEFGDLEEEFNWVVFAPFASVAILCMVVGCCAGSIVKAIDRNRTDR